MIDNFLERFDRVRKTGNGWEARCPAHDDRVASLSIAVGNKHPVVLDCKAGCSFDDVIRAAGIDIKELLADDDKPQSIRYEDATETYDYQDEAGNLLFKVARFVPKTFRPFHLDNGRWKHGMGGQRRVPYRLPQIIEQVRAGKWVLITEGERDVHTLEKLGFVATTNPGGADKWSENWCAYFGDARVAILPDNDEPGRNHAQAVAKNLKGVAQTIKIIELPVAAKGDVTDWVRAGHGAEELKQIITSAPEWDAKPFDVDVVTVADVEARKVEWLWYGYLPLGKIVTLEGDPGLGKSTITLDLAAKLSTGSPMPDGQSLEGKHSVLLFTAEDSVADTIRPRLEVAGADLNKVHVVKAVRTDDGPRQLRVPEDIERIAAVVTAYETRMVIIDPFIHFLSPDIDSHRDHEIRRAMYPLTELAERLDICILLMRHLNKGQGKAIYRGGGSIGVTGAVRLGMVVGHDPDSDARALAVYKSNLAAVPDTITYRIVPHELTGIGRIKWGGIITADADEILEKKKSSRFRDALENR